MSDRTCFIGCSYTAGTGFELEHNDPDFWPVILHNRIPQLCSTEYINLGIRGASNEIIFSAATNAILDHKPKYVFVQWSGYPRLHVLLGIETYPCTQMFSWDAELLDHNLHTVNYSAEYLSSIRDRFLSLEHQHNQIKNIVYYTNTLIKLVGQLNCKIFFVNGLCTWDQDYFVRRTDVLPSQYTQCTQKFLNVATRDDKEVFTLYNKIHTDYQQFGGIQETYWLNLYNSLMHNKIDVNQDNRHPGKQSNLLFFDLLSQPLLSKLSS